MILAWASPFNSSEYTMSIRAQGRLYILGIYNSDPPIASIDSTDDIASLDESFGPVLARNSEVRIRAGLDVCDWACYYTVLQTAQRPEACSSAYGTL